MFKDSLRSPGATYHTHLTARAATAQKQISAIGLESPDCNASSHRQPFEHVAGFGMHAHQLAFVVLPGAADVRRERARRGHSYLALAPDEQHRLITRVS